MSTTAGKKKVVTTGSGHNVVAPPEVSNNPPPPTAGPVPAPYVVKGRSATGSKTQKALTVGGKPVLTEDSHMDADPPANQPSQPTAGDVQTHAVKGKITVKSGSSKLLAGGKKVSCTMDTCAVNVITPQSEVSQQTGPLLGGAGSGSGGSDDSGDADGDAPGVATAPAQKAKKTGAPGAASGPDAPGCSKAGEPVAVIMGTVVDDKGDLTLPGMIGLVWTRSYSSARRTESGPLGRGGWALWCDQHVSVTDEALALRDTDGRDIFFDKVAEDASTFHRRDRLELHADTDGRYRVFSLDTRQTRSFAKVEGASPERAYLQSISDVWGNRIQFEYQAGLLSRIIDTAGRQLLLRHDAEHRIIRVEVWAAAPGSDDEPSLQTWFDYAYDDAGCLCCATDASGHHEMYEYDAERRRTAIRWKNGWRFYYAYDPETGRCIKTWGDQRLHNVDLEYRPGIEVLATGHPEARRYVGTEDGYTLLEEASDGSSCIEREYDEDRYLVAVANALGETVVLEHDERGNRTAVVDPAGNALQREFEDDLLVLRRTPDGQEIRYTHNRHGALESASSSSGQSSSFEYDSQGRVVAVYSRAGLESRFAYDAHHNLVEGTDARGARTSFTNDALGRPTSRTDVQGRATSVTYDALGRVTDVVHPDRTATAVGYDSLGNVTRHVSPTGETTEMRYAGTGVLVELREATGQQWRFEYDRAERVRGVINPRGERHAFHYDRSGKVVEERTFDGRRIRYHYDLASRVRRVELPDGRWREFSYDVLGNLIADHSPDGSVQFERDVIGRLVEAVVDEVTGKVVTRFERDAIGRIVGEIQNGRRLAFRFDEQGRRSERTLPGGQTTSYGYGLGDDLCAIAHDGHELRIERDLLGRTSSRSAPGLSETFQYDDHDRLLEQRIEVPAAGAASVQLNRRTYSYDAAGRVTSVSDALRGATQYRYDSLGRLLEADRPRHAEIFEYDVTGSLQRITSKLAKLGQSGPWRLEPGNVLREREGVRYDNDACLRRTRKTQPGAAGEMVTAYKWDCRDRLREAQLPDGRVARYTYDAFGRRTKKVVVPRELANPDPLAQEKKGASPPLATTEYLYDGHVLCAELMPDDSERVHVHELGSFIPVLQQELGEVFSVLTDHIGLPTDLIDTDGRRAWSAVHSAWGQVVEVHRDEGTAEVASPFRLQGQYHDEETGLCYTRHRYFDPEAGRWCSPDALGINGDINGFAFGVAPTVGFDPLGLVSCARTGTPIPGRTFRGDKRSPKEIFPNGFKARGGTDDLNEYVSSNKPSNYISTSKEAKVAASFAKKDGSGGWIYEVVPPNGIDVNKTLGPHGYQGENEVAVHHEIPSSNVVRAWPIDENGNVGAPVNNKDFTDDPNSYWQQQPPTPSYNNNYPPPPPMITKPVVY